MDKGFWMAKASGNLTDGETVFDNSSRLGPKRSHRWFADDSQPELFPNKKQVVQVSNSKSNLEIPSANVLSWENASGFQSVPNQFIDRLFGSETPRPVNLTERSISPVGTEDLMHNKVVNEQFGTDSSIGLSMSYTVEDQQACVSFGGIRKVKVNQVKDPDSNLPASKAHNDEISIDQASSRVSETSFIPMGQAFGKEDESVTLMGHAYDRGDANIRSMGSAFGNFDSNALSVGHTYNKGDTTTISFGGYIDEADIDTLARPIRSYDLLYNQSSVQTPETQGKEDSDALIANAVLKAPQIAKSRSESASKNKSDSKPARKEAPNSFPSNVRSLIATGMLDGVPVKYVSVSREELRGVIKGSGYLCGCQSCNYSKVLNAFEFERHANSKTKHPNNHIYFENGKTIYQIVQELRSTPESLLFETIQTITGSPINQKAFRIWKESFLAATRELQRIYGKEENL